jgi:stage II sporulation protein D
MRFRAVALAALLLLIWIAPVSAKQNSTIERVGEPVRLIASGTRPIKVGGLTSYLDEIRISSAADGLVVVNRLPLERYLLGLAEVPPYWPREALRAQAVAARTYALYTLNRPRAGAAAKYGFDICASFECQVFSGADVLERIDGWRWAEAVNTTKGESVLFRGDPILARYHSVSGGRTLDNSEAFPTEPDYPYLQDVSSTTENASPLDRWSARFPLDDVEVILRNAGRWPARADRLRGVKTAPSSHGLHYPDLVFVTERGVRRRVPLSPNESDSRSGGSGDDQSGRDGSSGKPRTQIRTVTVTDSMRISAERFRSLVRTRAPKLAPARYPSLAPTSTGRLPETLPSNRIEAGTRDGVVIVDGRGWGHGVGMSQWGAYGLAQRGSTYIDILEHYYPQTSVAAVDEPGPLDVGVAWGLDEVKVSGVLQIVDESGATVAEQARGSWTLRPAGPGTVAIAESPGSGRPFDSEQRGSDSTEPGGHERADDDAGEGVGSDSGGPEALILPGLLLLLTAGLAAVAVTIRK